MEITKKDRVYIAVSFLLVLFGLLLLKLSNFSASVMVNLQNYIIKTVIINTSGMSTLGAVYYFLSPFLLVVAALVFFAFALAVMMLYGINEKGDAGIIAAALAAVMTLIVTLSIWGIFLAAGLFVAFFFAPKISPAYTAEIKKYVEFRAGAKTVSRCLFFANILIALGLFLTVLSAQAAYEASFLGELTDSMRTVALSIPGASLLPEETLTDTVNQVIGSSEIFNAYIRWLPVTTALSAWFVLELLRNILLANLSGLFTYIASKIW